MMIDCVGLYFASKVIPVAKDAPKAKPPAKPQSEDEDDEEDEDEERCAGAGGHAPASHGRSSGPLNTAAHARRSQ
jgi:hypothetical protein